nr:multifunctional expression regulator [Macronycteris gammaherpesvirus 1]
MLLILGVKDEELKFSNSESSSSDSEFDSDSSSDSEMETEDNVPEAASQEIQASWGDRSPEPRPQSPERPPPCPSPPPRPPKPSPVDKPQFHQIPVLGGAATNSHQAHFRPQRDFYGRKFHDKSYHRDVNPYTRPDQHFYRNNFPEDHVRGRLGCGPPNRFHPQQSDQFPLYNRQSYQPGDGGNSVSHVNLLRSLEKMQLPSHMLRKRPSSPPCDLASLPTPTPALVVPAPLKLHSFLPEKFSDSTVQKMVDRAASPQEPLNKTISYKKLASKYAALKIFTTKTVNMDKWLGLRKDTIMSSSFMSLVLFCEELLMWMKLNIENDANLDEKDVILQTAELLCSTIIFKLKPITSCLEESRQYCAMVKQLSYLFCASGRVLDAGQLLRELKVGGDLATFVGFVVSVPVILAARRRADLYEHGKSFVSVFQPGTLCALCNKMFSKLNSSCTDGDCSNTVKAVIGSSINTKGLIFVPGM